ncbi:cell division protein FtsZ [Candidatus Marithioploca araucensis]|uniref:Cell division protein FtsZ n=1 Tax=Candidatus Marithioploca araucensis TaxID=70273 RepID=A0ABT7VQK4_9GAMM|nr:cell division protein FtsZ [Thiotrichales bacterium HSG14]MDM8561935.1 cell division protein FtsZ [Candidatus Marithioploca araucensis]
MDTYSQNAVIKVVGVGGGGGNAVEHMLQGNIEGVEFICANTDAQALKNSSARTILQLGTDVTKGLGAGANPEIGQQAAVEDRERVMGVLEGTDMVFITAGMGGGTGTGAAPVVAQVAKDLGILTVAVVTRPFPFEGRKRALIADEGIKELSQHVDSLIIIPNEKLLKVLGKDTTLLDAFKKANEVLYNAVQGISELITCPGLINVDFADVTTVMQEMGQAMMGTGYAKGEGRARKAGELAINSPLLEDIDLSGARGILVNMTAGMDLSIGEFEEMGNVIEEFASENATVVVGTVLDPDMEDEMRVTVIATGVGPVVNKQQSQERQIKVVPTPPVVEKPGKMGDYREFDKPTVTRLQTGSNDNTLDDHDNSETQSGDYLDIPAFLRRQAD